MRRFLIALLLLGAAAATASAQGPQGKRIALLIGNKDYKPGVGALVNPLNDVRVVGDALKAVGFEVLKPVQNATRTTFLLATHEFAAKLRAAGPDAVGFLYYSGHGIASLGENYLIPIDVEAPSTQLLSVAGVKQSEVLTILRNEAPNAAHYLVLDACRNTLQGARGGKGFIPVGQQSGVLVAFAAEPGKTASDIGRGTGPYAAALAEELVKPGQNDLLMFHRVRVAVIQKTGGDQVPWTEDGIQRPERVLFGGENKPALIQAPQLAVSEAAREWARVDKTSVAELETFVRRHGASPEADYARARIDSLKRQVAVATPTPRPEADLPKFSGPCGATATVAGGVAVLVGSEHRCLKPKDSFKDCPDCPEMVVVPAGEFMMGSPANERERISEREFQVSVTVAKPLGVARFAVTRGEFAAFVTATDHRTGTGCGLFFGQGQVTDNSWRSVGFAQTDSHPVVCVNWSDAKSYTSWLSRKTGKNYRLLSETEREYVARAGTTTPFWWGSAITPVQANYDGTVEPYKGGGSKGENRMATVPVQSFAANPWGFYNVHGNVYEWTEDCWNEGNTGNPGDGSARITGDCGSRVVRGGSWYYLPAGLRSAARSGANSSVRFNNFGFRVARTLAP